MIPQKQFQESISVLQSRIAQRQNTITILWDNYLQFKNAYLEDEFVYSKARDDARCRANILGYTQKEDKRILALLIDAKRIINHT